MSPRFGTITRKILSKCQRLPLVIVAIAGLSSKKEKTESEWQRVLENLNYELKKMISSRLFPKFSYSVIMIYLTILSVRCFLYFGIFPENYSILDQRLYRLWIAEVFIKSRGNMTLEQVGLNQLIDRNLVSFEVKVRLRRYCWVHDLMNDIILKMADELCFFQTLNKSKLRLQEKTRRISIYGSTPDILEKVGVSRTRSVFLLNTNKLTTSFVVSLFESFKLLKILDMENAPLNVLPKEVGNLVLLKYLSLRYTKAKKLLKSIGKPHNLFGKPHNLQTLDVSRSLVRELPVEIKKLRKLRHLIAYWAADQSSGRDLVLEQGVRIYEGIGRLEELQTLMVVAADPNRAGSSRS